MLQVAPMHQWKRTMPLWCDCVLTCCLVLQDVLRADLAVNCDWGPACLQEIRGEDDAHCKEGKRLVPVLCCRTWPQGHHLHATLLWHVALAA